MRMGTHVLASAPRAPSYHTRRLTAAIGQAWHTRQVQSAARPAAIVR